MTFLRLHNVHALIVIRFPPLSISYLSVRLLHGVLWPSQFHPRRWSPEYLQLWSQFPPHLWPRSREWRGLDERLQTVALAAVLGAALLPDEGSLLMGILCTVEARFHSLILQYLLECVLWVVLSYYSLQSFELPNWMLVTDFLNQSQFVHN